MRNRSRLSSRLERKTKKNLILSILGTVVIIFLLFKVGIPLIANVGLFISNIKDSQEVNTVKKEVFVAIPMLESTYTATHSATVDISGSIPQKLTVLLYVNDSLTDRITPEKDNAFTFKGVSLKKGTNTIKAKAENDDKKESDFSNTITIIYKNDKPNLTIDDPSDGKTFSKDENTAKVTGKTDQINKVTVNGFWAIVDSEGKYSYTLPLQNGENQIKVTSTDEAGNTIEIERKVTYNP